MQHLPYMQTVLVFHSFAFVCGVVRLHWMFVDVMLVAVHCNYMTIGVYLYFPVVYVRPHRSYNQYMMYDVLASQIKVYYEDFSNTTQQKWVSPRDDVIRQFGLYQLGSGGSSPGGGDSDSDNDGDGDGDNSHQNNPRQKKSGSVKKKNTQAKKRKRGEGKNNCHM